mmetsp:Transcript_17797/g.36231  ORF Transcript_17797/g.36231 Transcript_17797/m.36231 type:complete len:144 (-) Transcript_17797:52-483(-)
MHPIGYIVTSAHATSSLDDIANIRFCMSIIQSSWTTTTQAGSLESKPSSISLTAITDNSTAPPKTMDIIVGTLGRQGDPTILSQIQCLLDSREILSIIVSLSEIFPKRLEMTSNQPFRRLSPVPPAVAIVMASVSVSKSSVRD